MAARPSAAGGGDQPPVAPGHALRSGHAAAGQGAEAARLHGGGEAGGAANGADQQGQQLPEVELQGCQRGASGGHAPCPARQRDGLPLTGHDRQQPHRGQRPDREARRQVELLDERVGQLGRVGGHHRQHAGVGNGQHAESQRDAGLQALGAQAHRTDAKQLVAAWAVRTGHSRPPPPAPASRIGQVRRQQGRPGEPGQPDGAGQAGQDHERRDRIDRHEQDRHQQQRSRQLGHRVGARQRGAAGSGGAG